MGGLGHGGDCAGTGSDDGDSGGVVCDLPTGGEEQPRCAEVGGGEVGEDGAYEPR